MKLVPRGDTTVVDAYLSPILRRYCDKLAGSDARRAALFHAELRRPDPGAALLTARMPSCRVPPAASSAWCARRKRRGIRRLIGFDMGGTSTDVSHFAGEYERAFDTEVGGVRVRAPMMSIHSIAAGGGSIIRFDGARLRVGPESAGANPGPASYRRGGPLTVTDANVLLGRIQPRFFPRVFGPAADRIIGSRRSSCGASPSWRSA